MKRLLAASLAAVAASAAFGQGWADNFDTYSNGQALHGVNGWKGWDNTPTAGANVSNLFSSSPANSVEVTGGSDLVHEYSGVTSGTWRYKAQVYVPSSLTSGSTYFILMNRYVDGALGAKAWSAEYEFNLATNQVDDDFASPSTTWGNAPSTPQPIVRNAWTDILVEFDPVANTAKNYYNGALLHGPGRLWYEPTNANAVPQIQCVDLYANNVGPVYYDNLELVRVLKPENFTYVSGIPFGGDLASLLESDDNALFILNDENDQNGEVTFNHTSPFAISFLRLNAELGATRSDLSFFFSVKNQNTNAYTVVGTATSTLADSKRTFTLSNAGAYASGTGAVETRLFVVPQADLEAGDGWATAVDMWEVEVR